MSPILISPLLRFALRLDGVLSLLAGAATCAASAPLAQQLGAPEGVVWGLGLFMLGYGIVAGLLGACRQLPRWAVWSIVIGNALWALDSVLLAFSGWIAPSTAGLVLLLGQALLVAVICELQWLGLRRSTPA